MLVFIFLLQNHIIYIVYYYIIEFKEIEMDLVFCNEKCPIGIAAKNLFLESYNSAFDAAYDFNKFAHNCVNVCYFIDAHKNKDKVNEE